MHLHHRHNSLMKYSFKIRNLNKFQRWVKDKQRKTAFPPSKREFFGREGYGI